MNNQKIYSSLLLIPYIITSTMAMSTGPNLAPVDRLITNTTFYFAAPPQARSGAMR